MLRRGKWACGLKIRVSVRFRPRATHIGQALLTAQGFKSGRRQDVGWQDLSLRSKQHSIGLPLDVYGG